MEAIEGVVENVPICPLCKHPHEQGVKCAICGHVGKSQMYEKMKSKADQRRALTTEIYTGESLAHTLRGQWDIIQELRISIFCEDLGIPEEREFNTGEEMNSRHIIISLGDMPVGTVRYRITATPDGLPLGIIDRLGVLPQYRGRKFAKYALDQTYTDIQNVSGQSVTMIVLFVQSGGWIEQKCIIAGMEVAQGIPVDIRGDLTFIPMIHRLRPPMMTNVNNVNTSSQFGSSR